MKKVQLPGTEMTVSRLCLGTVNFGAGLSDADSRQVLDAFLARGGNFIDTAHVYSDWIAGEKSRSEKLLGRALAQYDRKQIFLSTKGAHYDFQSPSVSRVTPADIERDLLESLENLRTDTIDLYFLHRDNPAIPVGEIMDCMEEQRRQGRFRYAGCSNWTLTRLAEAQRYARQKGIQGFSVNQLMWSLAEINRDQIPADYVLMDQMTMDFTRQEEMGIMCFTSLAKGYFTKRFLGAPLKADVSRVYENAENDQRFAPLAKLGDPTRITQRCLTYFQEQPVTAIPIVTFSSLSQLAECCDAFAD